MSAPRPRLFATRTSALVLALILGVVLGVVGVRLYDSLTAVGEVQPEPREEIDAVQAGLSWRWLAFGYAAQALFTGRMIVQWLATEKRKKSTVPPVFWWMSLFGGLMLLTYFVRRGDPVGVLGQLFGVVVYLRNLTLLARAGHLFHDPR